MPNKTGTVTIQDERLTNRRGVRMFQGVVKVQEDRQRKIKCISTNFHIPTPKVELSKGIIYIPLGRLIPKYFEQIMIYSIKSFLNIVVQPAFFRNRWSL